MQYLKKLLKIIIALLSLSFVFSCASSPWHAEQAEVFLNKGIAYIGAQQYPNALRELLEAEKYNPRNEKIYYYMGMAYHSMSMQEKAINSFKRAVYLKDDYSEAHNYLGTIYNSDKMWDKAIEHFNKAVANPTYNTPALPLYNAAWAYYSKKDYKKALNYNIRALQREPETILRPQIKKNMGLIYFDQHDFINAIYYFKQSTDLNPNLYDSYFFLGESYLKINDKTNARKVFQKVVDLAPQSAFGQKASAYLHTLN
ncbi:MAG: tetratricopeptide repeat protein [Syntrophaceae bacterium]|nr:tetratricopeptide repeat protein [Syntrophaceae bacterium]